LIQERRGRLIETSVRKELRSIAFSQASVTSMPSADHERRVGIDVSCLYNSKAVLLFSRTPLRIVI
jgi:hypothetical protein